MTADATSSGPDTELAESVTDGRRLRREANRRAVIDALVSLYNDGQFEPTIDEIAERSGVSARSVFRYFADIEDLVGEAVEDQRRRLAPFIDISIDPTSPLEQRLATFVDHRMRVLDAMGNVAQVARMGAHRHPAVAAQVTSMRQVLRTQVSHVFKAELDQLPPKAARRCLAALDVLASFESHRLWREDQGLTARQAKQVLAESLRWILTGCLESNAPGSRP